MERAVSGSSSDDWAEVEYRQLVDGGMLFHAATGRIHHLNLTAARIWQARSRGESDAAIAQRLCDEFEVELPVALDDVRRVLAEFAAAGLPGA